MAAGPTCPRRPQEDTAEMGRSDRGPRAGNRRSGRARKRHRDRHGAEGRTLSAVATLRYYAEAIDKLHGEIAPTDPAFLGLVHREPVGVVGAIVPWNFPLMIGAWKFAPALAAGCTMVLKLAETASLTLLRAAELALEAGLPPASSMSSPAKAPSWARGSQSRWRLTCWSSPDRAAPGGGSWRQRRGRT